MILGHATATFMIVKAVRRNATRAVIGTTIIGAYFPDMIDKSLNILELGQARGYAHSLLFQSLFALLGWALIRRLKYEKIRALFPWFIFGALLHLLEDLLSPAILFWPFLGEIPQKPHYSIPEIFHNVYIKRNRPDLFIFEIVSHTLFIGYWIVVLLRRQKPKKLEFTS